MIVNLKNGIDKLLFGMKQNDVLKLYSQPDKQFSDDDDNLIFIYFDTKLRLTFYQEEDFRLGYIISSNPKLVILNHLVIGKKIDELKNELPFKSWEMENFDSSENHFNESNWLILQVEFNEVVKIEIGAIINDKDEFDFKF